MYAWIAFRYRTVDFNARAHVAPDPIPGLAHRLRGLRPYYEEMSDVVARLAGADSLESPSDFAAQISLAGPIDRRCVRMPGPAAVPCLAGNQLGPLPQSAGRWPASGAGPRQCEHPTPGVGACATRRAAWRCSRRAGPGLRPARLASSAVKRASALRIRDRPWAAPTTCIFETTDWLAGLRVWRSTSSGNSSCVRAG